MRTQTAPSRNNTKQSTTNGYSIYEQNVDGSSHRREDAQAADRIYCRETTHTIFSPIHVSLAEQTYEAFLQTLVLQPELLLQISSMTDRIERSLGFVAEIRLLDSANQAQSRCLQYSLEFNAYRTVFGKALKSNRHFRGLVHSSSGP
jgi:hypothetical protein